MAKEPRTECRTPTPNKSAKNIPTWKFDVVSDAIVKVVGSAGSDGLPFADLPNMVRDQLDADTLQKLGSIGWHVTTVKLELEVRGDLVRLDGTGPQQLKLGR